jgi:ribosomal protein S18 acetylase RimI-like enzyme
MVTIRRLRPEDDLADLIGLSRHFFEEYATHHEFFQLDELRDEDILGFFTRSLDGEQGATYVGELEGEIVGYITVFVRPQATLWRVKEYGTISGLMVRSDQRRRGLATRLLAEAIEFFRQKGIRYYTVYTAAANQAAISLYEGRGMAPLHITMIGDTEGARE